MAAAIQYLTDESGERTGVILTISDCQRLLEDMEDMEDLADIVNRQKDSLVPHDEFLAQLRKEGILSN